MEKIITTIIFAATLTHAHAVGTVNFANTSSTLISVGGVPMPVQSVQQFNFAVFLASSSTVAGPGITPALADPVFQLAGGYNTNTTVVAGRMASRFGLDVDSLGGYAPGDRVDFVVRGWSANLGTTWSEALANWNNGNPLVPNSAMGSSTIGNDLYLGGGAFPSTTLFGVNADLGQVSGFNMVPEPSSLVLAGLGVVAMLASRRRK